MAFKLTWVTCTCKKNQKDNHKFCFLEYTVISTHRGTFCTIKVFLNMKDACEEISMTSLSQFVTFYPV